jgi:hypothetical protein
MGIGFVVGVGSKFNNIDVLIYSKNLGSINLRPYFSGIISELD